MHGACYYRVPEGLESAWNGKRVIYEWSEQLRESVAMAKSVRPVSISPWLFCNRRGECCFNETRPCRRMGHDVVQLHDAGAGGNDTAGALHRANLRAKCASDARTLEHAQALLAHAGRQGDAEDLPKKTGAREAFAIKILGTEPVLWRSADF